MNGQSKQMLMASLIISIGIVVSSVIFVSASGTPAGPVTRKFSVIMENNRYDPSTITVNLGDEVIIDFENLDDVGHAVEIPEFNAKVPGGHVQPGKKATMAFLADKRTQIDAATCGGADPTDKTDDHGEELIINVI